MIDERLIEIVAKNYSSYYLNKHKTNVLEKMIRGAYIEGFKEGLQKAIETCGRCDGQDENFKHIADVCKSCKRNKAVIEDGRKTSS